MLFVLGLLGLPWSLVWLIGVPTGVLPEQRDAVENLLLILFALLNLLLHGALSLLSLRAIKPEPASQNAPP